MNFIRTKLAGLSPAYFVETGWLAAGFVSKLSIQMGTLWYLTANLGPSGTGTFFALIGLLACLVPFVQMGNYDLTIRAIARREDPKTVAGRAMRSTVVAFLVMLPILMGLRLVAKDLLLTNDVGWAAFLLVATSELLVMRVISNVQAVATGFRLHYVAAICDFLIGAARFVAVFAAAHYHGGVDVVLTAYAFTALPAAFAAYGWMVYRIGMPHLRGGSLLNEVADHRRMVVAWFGEMAAREGDKPLLHYMTASPGQVGIYGTATRMFAVCIVPIDLLSQVFRPRVGQAYADGEQVGRSLSQKMAIAMFGIGLMTGLGMFVVASVLPYVAPKFATSQFAEVRVAMLYLAVLPPVYGLQRASVITAISRGATHAYAIAMTIGAASSALAIVLLSHYGFGWRGACAGLLMYLGTSCITLYAIGRAADRETAAGGSAGEKAEVKLKGTLDDGFTEFAGSMPASAN